MATLLTSAGEFVYCFNMLQIGYLPVMITIYNALVINGQITSILKCLVNHKISWIVLARDGKQLLQMDQQYSV